MPGRVVLYRAAFSPDGKLLATVSEDNTVRLWDVATRQPVGPSITGHEVLSVAFSPGGKLLAIGGSDLDLWDVASRQPVRQPLRGDTHSAFCRRLVVRPPKTWILPPFSKPSGSCPSRKESGTGPSRKRTLSVAGRTTSPAIRSCDWPRFGGPAFRCPRSRG